MGLPEQALSSFLSLPLPPLPPLAPPSLPLLHLQAAKFGAGADGERKATFARNLAALNSQFAA